MFDESTEISEGHDHAVHNHINIEFTVLLQYLLILTLFPKDKIRKAPIKAKGEINILMC